MRGFFLAIFGEISTPLLKDNAGNFGKAFRLFGLKDIRVQDAYESELENSSEVILLDDDSEEDNLRFISFEEIEEAMDINLQAEELLLLPSQKPCASHTLSLIAVTDLRHVKFDRGTTILKT